MRDPMVHCHFYIRRPSPVPGKYIFDSAYCGSPGAGVVHRTTHPPSMGDQLAVTDEQNRLCMVRVIARDWDYPQYGSFNWPTGESSPKDGPGLTIIVEECEGMFHNQYLDETATETGEPT